MFKKLKEFGDKPITWKAYGKLCGICALISIVEIAGWYIAMTYDVKDLVCKKFWKIKHKLMFWKKEED